MFFDFKIRHKWLIRISAPLWPSRLRVPPYNDVVIDVVREQPLTDVSQVAEIKEALLKLRPKVCTDRQGRRQIIQRSRVAHTWTEIFALCEDEGFDLQDQKAKLTAALRVLYQGQETYGPAAIYGEINSVGINPRRIGQIGAHVLSVPPTPQADWPEVGVIILRIYASETLRLRVQTVSAHPTLDVWDTMWFRKLCEQTQFWLRDQVLPPQTPMRSFWIQLDPYWKQQITIRFEPLNIQRGEVATIEVLTNIMQTLISILDYYGARPMIFSVLSNEGGYIGVGYLEFGQLPPQLGVLNATTFDPINQTAVLGEADKPRSPERSTAIQ